MKIEVLGTGCRRCDDLYENARVAASQMASSGDIEVTKVADVNYFMQKGVFVTPGFIIDGKVVSTGKLLSVEEIIQHIKEHL
jgi:small redox-active disulfide protein 2